MSLPQQYTRGFGYTSPVPNKSVQGSDLFPGNGRERVGKRRGYSAYRPFCLARNLRLSNMDCTYYGRCLRTFANILAHLRRSQTGLLII